MKDQTGRKVDISTLLNEGWKKVGTFGYTGVVLRKGNTCILYSTKDNSVVVQYSDKVSAILGC